MVCLYLYFELRAGGQQYTPTYFLVTRSSAFCISNPILDQLTGGTSQMGGFFCTFYCWLAACFLKSALWIINRLHKHRRDMQFYRKAGGLSIIQSNIPTSCDITKIDRKLVCPPIGNLREEVAMIDWMFERCQEKLVERIMLLLKDFNFAAKINIFLFSQFLLKLTDLSFL